MTSANFSPAPSAQSCDGGFGRRRPHFRTRKRDRQQPPRVLGARAPMASWSPVTAVAPLCEAVKGSAAHHRANAIDQIATIVDTSFGDEASELCEYLRQQGVVRALTELLGRAEPSLHQPALRLVGNLASEAVDPRAALTKAEFKELGGFEKLLPYLFAAEWVSLVYALGAMQNTCLDADYVEIMQDMGIVPRLQELVRAGDEHVSKYARGCLTNVRVFR